jgi:hypothetical protein
MDLKRDSHCLFEDITLTFSWQQTRKPQKTSIKTAGNLNKI